MGKVTDEELKSITEIRQEITQVVYALGEVEYQAVLLENSKNDLKEKINNARVKELKLFNDLRAKYGNASINIETGEF